MEGEFRDKDSRYFPNVNIDISPYDKNNVGRVVLFETYFLNFKITNLLKKYSVRR